MNVDLLFKAFEWKRERGKAGSQLEDINYEQIITLSVSDLLGALDSLNCHENTTQLARFLVAHKEDIKELIREYLPPDAIAYDDFMRSSAYVLLNTIVSPSVFYLDARFTRMLIYSMPNQTNDTRNRLIEYLKARNLSIAYEQDAEFHFYQKATTTTKTHAVYSQDNNALHNLSIDFMEPITTLEDLDIANDDLQQKSFNNTPLLLAAKTGYHDLAMLLTKASESQINYINETDSHGMTALHWACLYRDDELIQLLLDKGADQAKKNNIGQSALDIYTTNLPRHLNVMHIAGDKAAASIFLNFSPIAEKQNRFSYDLYEQNVLDPSCYIDILFHMDKIAYHRLGVCKETLVNELKTHDFANRQINHAFEIFTYYHLSQFVMMRNASPLSEQLIHRLQFSSYIVETENLETRQLPISIDNSDNDLGASSEQIFASLDNSANEPASGIFSGISPYLILLVLTEILHTFIQWFINLRTEVPRSRL